MPFESGNLAQFHWGTSDLSAYIKSVSFKVDRNILKLARLGGNQVAKLPGPPDPEFTLEGWYHPTLSAVFATAALGTAYTAGSFGFKMQSTGEWYRGTAYVGAWSPEADAEQAGRVSLTLAPDENGVTFSAS